MPFGLCFVGLGSYAEKVLDNLGDSKYELDLYFASRDASKAKAFSDRYGGCGSFGSYEHAASDDRIEGMYFVTPHHLHLVGARLAASHGKHILMEKPIARTVDESHELIKSAKGAGVTLMIAENYHFAPTIVKAREMIAQGLIGNLRLVQVQRETYSEQSDWRNDLEFSGGGMFMDAGIHDMHALITLGGFPERIYAVNPPRVFASSPGEDGIVVTANLPGGAVGLIQFSRATPISGCREQIWVTGTKGQLAFKPFGDKIVVEMPMVKRSVRVPTSNMGVPWIMREFIAASRDGRKAAMCGEEGLDDLTCILAAYESIRTGNSVDLPKQIGRSTPVNIPDRLQSPKKAIRHDPKALV